jgi:hypothetical protein
LVDGRTRRSSPPPDAGDPGHRHRHHPLVQLLSAEQIVTDPAAVAGGIAEALFTTAFGLVVALLTLFPHAIFRSQADRCADAAGTDRGGDERASSDG